MLITIWSIFETQYLISFNGLKKQPTKNFYEIIENHLRKVFQFECEEGRCGEVNDSETTFVLVIAIPDDANCIG